MVKKIRIYQSILLLMCVMSQLFFPALANAKGQILGIHILSPGEITLTDDLLGTGSDQKFVTIPLSLADLQKKDAWQTFFDECAKRNVVPIVRLVTVAKDGTWSIPTKANIMAYATFLSALDWHADSLHIVLFNEPNHANEWGNTLDPESFATVSAFASDWFHTEKRHYIVLPAGLDLAADGKNGTMEEFAFWKKALASVPDLFDRFDGWTSHSYPNPGFTSTPKKTGKSSLRGYQYELDFIKEYTSKQLPVYITETGWDQRPFSTAQLRSYYRQAYEQIWEKDDRVVAVTPFILQGSPGVFAPFSFLDAAGKPTKTFEAYQSLFSNQN